MTAQIRGDGDSAQARRSSVSSFSVLSTGLDQNFDQVRRLVVAQYLLK
ncbi:MAG: hypothetical protein ACYDEH_00130 [Acidimicrobiales bacterium]